MERKFKVGIIGATGMVGQRFVSLLAEHPWFEIAALAASPRSAGKTYKEAVGDNWALTSPMPDDIAQTRVVDASNVDEICNCVDFVFCAIKLDKAATGALEEAFARREIPVVSANSAHRLTPDVPMIIPELNPKHASIIDVQRKRLGTKTGFITVKSNCSIQSYLPALFPLMKYNPLRVIACTYQAISGAGKTFKTYPEILDNVIPFIAGEDEKSEIEPLKILGAFDGARIVPAEFPVISAQCVRVPVSDGHLAAVSVEFGEKPSKDEIIEAWRSFEGEAQRLKLPSAPTPLFTYFDEEDRPQTKLDRDIGNGMGISMGRLREDSVLDYKFVCLSHNTLRGAAGGAVLTAELLASPEYGYIIKK